jgi:2-phosphosulfolactate phosphatase
MKRLEVLFTPAEFERLPGRDLSRTTCVVFDILRATSCIVTALANGAESVRPVSTIEEAVRMRAADARLVLAGERDGVRITARQSGGMEFDLGNSPREFTRARVGGRKIVTTTTNGTRALRACAAARTVWVGAFLNLTSLTRRLQHDDADELLLVCSGTHEEASTEDLLAAGAVADLCWEAFGGAATDSAHIARSFYTRHRSDLLGAMEKASNGRRLLAMPQLAEDVVFCLQQDSTDALVQMTAAGECVRVAD